IHKNSGGSRDPDALCGSEKSVWMSDHLVTGAHAKGHKRQPDRVRPVPQTDSVLGSVISGQLPFKALEHRTHDILTALQDRFHIGINFPLDIMVLTNVPVEFN